MTGGDYLYQIIVSVVVAAVIEMLFAVTSRSVLGLIFGNKTLDFDKSVAAGEVKSALVVDFNDLNKYAVAYVDNVLNLVNTLYVKAADVNKSLFTGSYLDERTEAHKSCDYAVVN